MAESAEVDEQTAAVFKSHGYTMLNAIGHGAFGQVYKAQRECDTACAVKVMDLTKISKRYMKKFLPRELVAMMEMQHPNIIQVYDIIRSNKKVYIFMEFATNGDLAKYLKRNGALSELETLSFFVPVTNALNYLHEEMFTAHRDLKIDNILLCDNFEPKLTDFGFATEAVDISKAVMSKTWCGTMPYYSPQILLRQPYNPFKSDVWANGVCLFALIHNKFPFHHKDPAKMSNEQKDKKFLQTREKRGLSSALRDLLRGMLNENEHERYSMRMVLSHPWVKTFQPSSRVEEI